MTLYCYTDVMGTDDMRKSIFEDARIRAETDEDRGRVRNTLMNFRPSNIEKNIVNTEVSRNRSEVSVGPRDNDSNSSSVNSSNGKVNEFRPNRYRHPLSAYTNDQPIEAIVPNHSLYLKYQNQSTRTSKATLVSKEHEGSKSTQRTSISVSMNNEMIPAFNDLKMDLDDEDNEDDRISYLSSVSNDNKFAESLELLKNLEKQKHKEIIIDEEKKINIGRIQQRINNLKMFDIEENKSNVFSSIEQKNLIESLKKELQNLRRFNYKPILEALRRISTDYELNTVKDSEVNIKRLKTLIKTSSSIVDELWEEPISYSKVDNFISEIKNNSTDSLLPETRFLKEQLESFKYGTNNEKLSISFDPSPKSTRI